MKNVFVCLSHTLTNDQVADLQADSIVLVSSELKNKTSQIPATATLQEIQALAAEVVAEAVKAGATHFVCQGEPTLAMWANLFAHGGMTNDNIVYSLSDGDMSGMTCISSTTERTSVDVPQADGSVLKTAVFKHVQWRNLF